MKLLKYIIAWLRIPHGVYCYRIKKISTSPEFALDVAVCPYWSMQETGNGTCKYLGISDFESEGITLLFDQTKECGIKKWLEW